MCMKKMECLPFPSLADGSDSLDVSLAFGCSYVVMVYMPYSKMAVQKLFFHLHVNNFIITSLPHQCVLKKKKNLSEMKEGGGINTDKRIILE